ncbi:hypothetical protein [Desertivirga xinjiangensis]|uniref:hypothetical protein n=1 Tax=Desertivirga xinjiangensis TaxID=539206 RepID=UPI00210B49A4|nr:hypothetical protein [Pedobacter xinjiangensis]
MAKKNKTKFPADRELQSEIGKQNEIRTSVYSSTALTTLSINISADDNLAHDLRAAVDDVLKFHGH